MLLDFTAVTYHAQALQIWEPSHFNGAHIEIVSMLRNLSVEVIVEGLHVHSSRLYSLISYVLYVML